MTEDSLLSQLPEVRGSYRTNADLSRTNWFRVGGPAEVLFKPEDTDDLSYFLKHKPNDILVTVLGVGSNVIVRDGGIPGVVIRLGRGFAHITEQDGIVTAGAAALDVNVANVAQQAGVAGLEFLIGIPGTIGGALAMNAGAYHHEMKDILIEAEAVDASGQVHFIANEAMGFRYRGNAIPNDWIFTQAKLQGSAGDPEEIARRMQEISDAREATQPIRTRTGGSTFANPDPAVSGGKRAWQLIDEAGCRGLQIGGAKVSEKHCNFLENTGDATAADLETLGETVRERVRQHSGVELHWEIRRIGTQGG